MDARGENSSVPVPVQIPFPFPSSPHLLHQTSPSLRVLSRCPTSTRFIHDQRHIPAVKLLLLFPVRTPEPPPSVLSTQKRPKETKPGKIQRRSSPLRSNQGPLQETEPSRQFVPPFIRRRRRQVAARTRRKGIGPPLRYRRQINSFKTPQFTASLVGNTNLSHTARAHLSEGEGITKRCGPVPDQFTSIDRTHALKILTRNCCCTDHRHGRNHRLAQT